MATLFDLTQQESGILVFDGSAVAAFNWSSLNDAEIPSFNLLLGAIGFPAAALDGDADELREMLPVDRVTDVRDVLPGSYYSVGTDDNGVLTVSTDMEVLYDRGGDLPALFGFKTGAADPILDSDGHLLPTAATVYTVGSVLVLAPDGWC